ncbi:cell division topological specificity factor MinE [Buchnera aphidicola]|uniref:cell division topological specificity factor MinE n=1 Tax=Buchnera aphidicola TaxID=9 RepID=UPI0031B8A18E
MSLLGFFVYKKKHTAYIAKKRLQFMFSKKKRIVHSTYFVKLKKELLSVINQNSQMTANLIHVTFHQKTPYNLTLDLNIISRK